MTMRATMTTTTMSTTMSITIIITTTPTRCSPAGAWRRRRSSPRRQIEAACRQLENAEKYGTVLRAKGYRARRGRHLDSL